MLKQLYKDERLDFVSRLLAKEDNYAIDHATEAAIHEFMSAGNSEELRDLMLQTNIGDSTTLLIVYKLKSTLYLLSLLCLGNR